MGGSIEEGHEYGARQRVGCGSPSETRGAAVVVNAEESPVRLGVRAHRLGDIGLVVDSRGESAC
ncbi:DBF4-type zinc finger-containing protein 2-like protein [Iris pallida]|uniref:DBF4-type zinc finger-containing protein 2-like protein n=1 Tax=Iris pallida TaxID=29817 RepID=A0AAX6IIG0_IRIPA|nr:DBF4-type zinc finger-containing protein 2-like protein [Iris pallida]